MGIKPSQLLIYCMLLQLTAAVKIGISKQQPITTTMSPNTTNTAMTAPTAPTTAITTDSSFVTTTDDVSDSNSEITDAAVTNITTTDRTTFPPIFMGPTRKSKTTTTAQTPVVSSTEAPMNATLEEILTNYDGLSDHRNYYCYCNLLLNVCDINCCCDPDCTAAALNVFDCYAVPKHPELRSRLEDFNYQHGLPSCKVNDGWLCVFRTNIKTATTTKKELNLDTSNSFKWSNLIVDDNAEDEQVSKEFYKYDEPLKIYNLQTMELQNFELPYGFRSSYCQLKEPIKHLQSFQRSCIYTELEKLQQNKAQLLELARTSKLLMKPQTQALNEQNFGQIKVKICREATKCEDWVWPTALSNNSRIDNYYLKEVRIQILHNYTHILSGLLELHEAPKPNQSLPQNAEFWQFYDVQFLEQNLTRGKTNFDYRADVEEMAQSGPLGYLQGEPVILAKLVANSDSKQPQIINYFQPNATKSRRSHTLSLFTKRQKLCYNKNDEQAVRINYGINTQKQCKVQLSISELTPSLNYTKICKQLQQLTLTTLFGNITDLAELGELLVSELGKPVNASERWLALQLKNVEDFTDFGAVVGELNAAASSFTCRNILLSAAYEFHVGTFIELGMPHQALIKYAALTLGQRHDLEFALDEAVEVPLTLSVMFFNLADNGGAILRFTYLHASSYALILPLIASIM